MKKILYMLLSCMLFSAMKPAEPFSIMQKQNLKHPSLLMLLSSRFVLSMYDSSNVEFVPDVASADFWKDAIVEKNVGRFAVGKNNYFFVLRDSLNTHKVCGLARFSIFPKYIHIHQLVIDSDYRGHCLGSVLLQEIEKLAFHGKLSLQLAVYNSNTSAIKFYEKNNFSFV